MIIFFWFSFRFIFLIQMISQMNKKRIDAVDQNFYINWYRFKYENFVIKSKNNTYRNKSDGGQTLDAFWQTARVLVFLMV